MLRHKRGDFGCTVQYLHMTAPVYVYVSVLGDVGRGVAQLEIKRQILHLYHVKFE